jgi:transcriptional regulator of acetoin/glycerol metabolism
MLVENGRTHPGASPHDGIPPDRRIIERGRTMMDPEQQMKSIWKDFVSGHGIGERGVRPVILESWNRCLGKVNPYQKMNEKVLSEADYERLAADNKELMAVGGPVLDALYKFVEGSGFVAVLSDANGHLLKVLGDAEEIEVVRRINLVKGADWSEPIMGTNAIGTCLQADKPLQIYAYEHWCVCNQVGVCSAAPIHDPMTGNTLGVLDITAADYARVHPHTLGMVVAAVGSIEGQIAAKRSSMRSARADRYKNLIIESISDGLLTIDNSGIITHINHKAIEFLSLYGNPLGESVFDILRKRFGKPENYRELAAMLESRENVDGEFVTIFTSSGVIKCTVTFRCLWENDAVTGKTIVIQEISKLKKIVNRVAGNRAQTVFSDIVGRNRYFLECVEMARRAAKTSSNVLLTGESGTGKDLFAQAIHNGSSRANESYIAINCAAIPRDLLGSELFGYMGGAFTGANRGGNPGKFELADHGSIFLDEIGEMPLDMQASLLRVLEEKAITRIGAKDSISVDIRIIAATNKDIKREVERGNFRYDLFYRFNVISILLPPLRERMDDIPILVEHLAKKIASSMNREIRHVDPGFIDVCMNYDWPGNIRELQNMIEKAISLLTGSTLSIRNMPPQWFEGMSRMDGPIPERGGKKLKEAGFTAESKAILAALARNQGNKCVAAKELGIARSSLYRKLKGIGSRA